MSNIIDRLNSFAKNETCQGSAEYKVVVAAIDHIIMLEGKLDNAYHRIKQLELSLQDKPFTDPNRTNHMMR